MKIHLEQALAARNAARDPPKGKYDLPKGLPGTPGAATSVPRDLPKGDNDLPKRTPGSPRAPRSRVWDQQMIKKAAGRLRNSDKCKKTTKCNILLGGKSLMN